MPTSAANGDDAGVQRRLLFGTIGVGLMVVGAGVLGIKALHLPQVAVVVFLGVLLVFGAWLTAAALFAFPPARPAPPGNHAKHVRRLVELAASGGRFEAGSSERRMLNAHYRRISRAHEVVEGSAQAETEAWDQLMQEVTAAVVQRFDGPLWQRGGIREEAQLRLHDQTTRVELTDGAFSHIRVLSTSGKPLPQVNWGPHIVWWATGSSPEADASDVELDAKAQEVREWFGEVSESEAARVCRDAILNVRTHKTELATAAEPVLLGAEVRFGRKCEVCNPKRSWQVWR
jgi:hypothetical protein